MQSQVKKLVLKNESLKSSALTYNHSMNSAHSLEVPLGNRPKKSEENELFYFDLAFLQTRSETEWVIGVDEVGRGPLAGPVTACAVAIHRDFYSSFYREKEASSSRNVWNILTDSKKLTPSKRALLFDVFLHLDPNYVRASIISLTPKAIDQLNILAASLLAMQSAVFDLLNYDISLPQDFVYSPDEQEITGSFTSRRSLWKSFQPPNPQRSSALIDGVHAPSDLDNQLAEVVTLKKGDARSFSIALASVLAKQHRDAIMQTAARIYPSYGFEKHMGYGTKKHLQALNLHGPCAFHRVSFAPVRNALLLNK